MRFSEIKFALGTQKLDFVCHVDFMLFVSISFVLKSQCENTFMEECGLFYCKPRVAYYKSAVKVLNLH